MRPEITELESFYASRVGQVARRLIARQVRQLWPAVDGLTVVGVGYAAPFLAALPEAAAAASLMPAGQGASAGTPRSALVHDGELPLADRSVDRLLLVHAVECAVSPGRLLRECWRVLADGGRLVLVVPNRRGLWSLSDRSPFGSGRPYSPTQLARLLGNQLFEPRTERGALFLPPGGMALTLRLAIPCERIGLGLAPHFAGVLVAEAEKRVVVGTPVLARQKVGRQRRYVEAARPLAKAPQPVARAA